MWSLKIPQRVKVFLWRAVRGVLPTRMRLQDKGVPCTDCCPFCETNYENDWHVFIGCEEVKTVWRTAGLWDLIAETVADAASFADCFFSLLCRLTADECKDIAMILWCIWRRRNDKVWDGELKPVSIAIQLAREVLFQWQTARQTTAAPQQPQQQQTIQWQPSAQGVLKCNVDAAIFNEQKSFGTGICIRDHRGHVIRASTNWYEGNPLPHEAEAVGLRDAILWLGQLGLSDVHIELDCKLVVDSICDKNNNQAEFGNIIADCRSLLQQFTNFKISFVRRQANVVAHSLARVSILHARHHVFDLIPSCITNLVMNEII
jgi:ribonuclease HI